MVLFDSMADSKIIPYLDGLRLAVQLAFLFDFAMPTLVLVVVGFLVTLGWASESSINANIIHAIENNDVQSISGILGENMPEVVGPALSLATATPDHVKVVRTLLQYSQSIPSEEYFAILDTAAQAGYTELVDIMLPPDSSWLSYEQCKMILKFAIRNCRIDLVKKFISQMSSLKYSRSVNSALEDAIKVRGFVFSDDALQVEIIQKLYAVASPDSKYAAILLALRGKHNDLVSMFLDRPDLPEQLHGNLLDIVSMRAIPANLFKMLVSDSRFTTAQRHSALMRAASWCIPEFLDILLDLDDLNEEDNNKVFRSAVTTIFSGSEVCTAKIINRPGVTPASISAGLQKAVSVGNHKLLQVIVDSGRVNEQERAHYFKLSMNTWQYPCAVVLLSPDSIDTVYTDGLTLLELSVNSDHWDAAARLIQMGATATKTNAFRIAAHSGDVSTVVDLLAGGEITPAVIRESLILAAGNFRRDGTKDTQANVDTLKAILRSPPVNDDNVVESFASSVTHKHPECFQVLLKHPAVVVGAKEEVFSQAIIEVEAVALDFISVLLKDQDIASNSVLLGDALLQAIDTVGSENFYNPLTTKQSEVVKLLSLMPSLTPAQKATGFTAALNGKHYTLAAILVSREDNVNTQYEFGNTLLHIMAWKGEYELVDRLLYLGASIEILNDFGKSYIHCATGEQGIGLRHELIDSQVKSAMLYTKVPGDINREILAYNHKLPIADHLTRSSIDFRRRRTLQSFDEVEHQLHNNDAKMDVMEDFYKTAEQHKVPKIPVSKKRKRSDSDLSIDELEEDD